MKLLKILLRKIGRVLPAKVVEDVFPINYMRACHERKIRMFAKLRSDYPYQWYESEVSNHDMKYPYRRARTVDLHPFILILMLKLELPQVLLPRSKAPNTDVRAFFLPVPAHVDLGPLRLSLYPPIPFPGALLGSVEIKPIQALCCLMLL